MPSLDALLGLSPALKIVSELKGACVEYITGVDTQGEATYRAVLERIQQPDRSGLDEAQYNRTLLGVQFVLGLFEAARGSDIEPRAKALEQDREYRINAWRLRAVASLDDATGVAR